MPTGRHLGNPTGHHSGIIPLFRNHLTRTAVATPPSLVNTVALAEHEWRDSHLSVVSQTPRMSRRKGDAWFWDSQNYPTCTASITTTLLVPRTPQGAAVEAANPGRQRQDFQQRDVVTFLSSPGPMAQERETRANCVEPSSATRARSLGATDDRRDYASLQSDGGRTHRTAPSAGRERRSLEIAGEAHLEVQAAKVTEAACRVGEAMEEMETKSLMEANLESADR